MMYRKKVSRTFALFALLLVSFTAGAHTRSKFECAQFNVFIQVHAYSRDSGALTKQTSLDILASDLALIKASPAQARWFVQDESDAKFIAREIARVFDDPLEPEIQGAAAEERCNALS
jgi:hypothetical protein